MERESFAAFVARALEEVIVLAEETTHKRLPRRFAFQWLGKAHPQITEDVVEYIVQRVYREHLSLCDRRQRGGVYALQLPSELDRTRGTIRLHCRESVHGKNGRAVTGMDT